jgi:hypothetical protein
LLSDRKLHCAVVKQLEFGRKKKEVNEFFIENFVHIEEGICSYLWMPLGCFPHRAFVATFFFRQCLVIIGGM